MNIFAVLDTSDAEDEVVQKAPKNTKPKEVSSDTKQANNAKSTTNNANTTAKPANNTKTSKQPQTTTKPAKVEKVDAKGSPAVDADAKEVKDDNRGGRPRGKEGNRRGEKPHGAHEEEKQRRPKREFERRSGTGRGKELSRGGRGPYGFGNVEQEAQDAEKDPTKAEGTEEAAVENTDDNAEPEPESEPVEEEPPSLSFDDFMKKREESRATSTFAPKNVRSVNVEAQFSGLTVKNEDKDEEERLNKQGSKRDQRSTTKTQVLDVQFKFENPNDFRGKREFNKPGRGAGRGEGRGNGGRGGARRPRQNNPPAQLNSGDFPSL